MENYQGYQNTPNVINRINWGAIFAGTFIALLSQLFFGLLGLAVGLSVIGPGQTISPQSMGVGTAIWIVLITLISVFIGTFAAGRYATLQSRFDGIFHGITTLAFLTIISLFLFTSGISNIVGGTLALGVQASQTPQAQQAIPSPNQMTGAAAPTLTPQQQQALRQQADRLATGTAWTAFITILLAIITAALGGYLGLRSRRRHMEQAV